VVAPGGKVCRVHPQRDRDVALVGPAIVPVCVLKIRGGHQRVDDRLVRTRRRDLRVKRPRVRVHKCRNVLRRQQLMLLCAV
jgi:hypothetical protein